VETVEEIPIFEMPGLCNNAAVFQSGIDKERIFDIF